MLRVDHVAYAVPDLDEADVRFRRRYGLDSVVGGRHDAGGTANRIVPLGEQYLELVAVVDEAQAAESAFGRGALGRAAAGGGWFTIAVVTDNLDAVASRLGLDITGGSRTRPDGETVRWRSAGIDDPRREPWMPFFISWDVSDELHPGRTRARHGVRVEGIAWVEVGGDAERLRTWLGGDEPPIRVTDGEPGIHRVAVATTADGELVIE